MAGNHERHAAWHQEAYAVYEILGETRVLIGRKETFLDAVDLAAEYLQSEDPEREGSVLALEILEDAKTVWRYAYAAAAPAFDPIAHWGFDALRWTGPARPGDGGSGRVHPS